MTDRLKWLAELKPGDPVVVVGQHGTINYYKVRSRTSKGFRLTNGGHFNNEGECLINGQPWYNRQIAPRMEEPEDHLRRGLIGCLKYRDWSQVPTDTLEQIVDLIQVGEVSNE